MSNSGSTPPQSSRIGEAEWKCSVSPAAYEGSGPERDFFCLVRLCVFVSRASRQGNERGWFTDVTGEGRSDSTMGSWAAVAWDRRGLLLVKLRTVEGRGRKRFRGLVRRIRPLESCLADDSAVRGADIVCCYIRLFSIPKPSNGVLGLTLTV